METGGPASTITRVRHTDRNNSDFSSSKLRNNSDFSSSKLIYKINLIERDIPLAKCKTKNYLIKIRNDICFYTIIGTSLFVT